MNEYQYLKTRIEQASNSTDMDRLDRACIRIYDAGYLTHDQFTELYELLRDKQGELDND